MRKLVKAAAALTAGCMLLSTSAFAMTSNLSVDGENLLTNGAITVNITGLKAGQSTIMVLKGDAALEDASEANIVYINQADIVDGAASYNVNLGAAFEGTATVYAGGTAETATKLGVLSVASSEVPATGVTILGEGVVDGAVSIMERSGLQLSANVLPENATDKSVVWSTDNAGVATVDSETGAVKAVGYGTAVITATCGTVSSSVNVSVKKYGDVNYDGSITTADCLTILKVAGGASISGFEEIVGDVNCDESITTADCLAVLKVAGGASLVLGPAIVE